MSGIGNNDGSTAEGLLEVTSVGVQDTTKVENALLSFDLLDAWMQDNHYILTHYRPMSNSFRKSLVSILSLVRSSCQNT